MRWSSGNADAPTLRETRASGTCMRHGRRWGQLTFCARCCGGRRFSGVCSCGTVEPNRPTHACLAPSWSEAPFASNSVRAVQSYSLPVSGVLPLRVRLPSVQFRFASCRSFPKREFVSLEFWKSIKTGHILGSFCQKALQSAPIAPLAVSSNISCNDILRYEQSATTLHTQLHRNTMYHCKRFSIN